MKIFCDNEHLLNSFIFELAMLFCLEREKSAKNGKYLVIDISDIFSTNI